MDGRFEFRRATRDGFPRLAQWLAEPHVARWWNHEFTPEAIERDFGPVVDGLDPSDDYHVVFDGRPIGYIQFCRFADFPDYVDELAGQVDVPDGAGSIDYFVGEPDCVGRGIGTAMIAAFTDRLWTTRPDLSCLIVPVNSANEASWRALLAAGFHRAGRGHLEPDNPIDGPDHEIMRLDRPGG